MWKEQSNMLNGFCDSLLFVDHLGSPCMLRPHGEHLYTSVTSLLHWRTKITSSNNSKKYIFEFGLWYIYIYIPLVYLYTPHPIYLPRSQTTWAQHAWSLGICSHVHQFMYTHYPQSIIRLFLSLSVLTILSPSIHSQSIYTLSSVHLYTQWPRSTYTHCPWSIYTRCPLSIYTQCPRSIYTQSSVHLYTVSLVHLYTLSSVHLHTLASVHLYTLS